MLVAVVNIKVETLFVLKNKTKQYRSIQKQTKTKRSKNNKYGKLNVVK